MFHVAAVLGIVHTERAYFLELRKDRLSVRSGGGSFSVSLTVVDAGVGQANTTADVAVQDWLIVSLGDSYASGEGAPDVLIAQVDIDAANVAQGDLDLAEAAAADHD